VRATKAESHSNPRRGRFSSRLCRVLSIRSALCLAILLATASRADELPIPLEIDHRFLEALVREKVFTGKDGSLPLPLKQTRISLVRPLTELGELLSLVISGAQPLHPRDSRGRSGPAVH
jgi:hypothetical protein